MSRHLQKEIENLKKKALSLCAEVEKNVSMASRALDDGDPNMALEVIKSDMSIDNKEIEVEEECLKILALHQPVAIDLRVIISILKMNNELERIGDLAVNIAERAHCLDGRGAMGEEFHIPEMTEQVKKMLKESVDALVNLDIDLAYHVCATDDKVDALNKQSFELLESLLSEGKKDVDILVQFMSVSRHLERIADHATNIAEDVIYMISGEIVRHHVGEHTERKEK